MLGLPGGEHRSPEHHVLGARPGLVDEELDGHPDPALVRPESRHGRHLPDADVKRIRHVSPRRVLTLRRLNSTTVRQCSALAYAMFSETNAAVGLAQEVMNETVR